MFFMPSKSQKTKVSKKPNKKSKKGGKKGTKGVKTSKKSSRLKKKNIQAPPSSEDMVVFKLIKEGDARRFSTEDFSDHWAEGRITLQEVEDILNQLRSVEGYKVHLVISKKQLARPEIFKLLVNREKNFNHFFASTNSIFNGRGLRFRAGPYGAWISLEKITPEFAKSGAFNYPEDQPLVDQNNTPIDPASGLQQQPKEHAKQVVGGLSSNLNYDYNFDDFDFDDDFNGAHPF